MEVAAQDDLVEKTTNSSSNNGGGIKVNDPFEMAEPVKSSAYGPMTNDSANL